MTSEKMQRSEAGTKAGIIGLSCNLMLAAAKLFAGMVSGSITIVADGANNLTDSISAFLTILGFRMEAMGEDEMHPYGHGRIEYVTGFLISLLILGTGVSVGKEAVMSIFHPKVVLTSALTVGILTISILMKLSMVFYYRGENQKIHSPVLEAAGKDSFCDACVSAVALTGIFAMPYCNLPLDGFLGLIMAAYILGSGVKSFQENLTLLLGEGTSRKVENDLKEIFSQCTEIESVREIKIHDYGPDKKVAVVEVNFAENCDREAKRRAAAYVVGLCKDTMNIDLSLYGSL